MLRRSNRNATGCKGRRGINRSAALWVLCRHRHKAHWTGHERRLNRSFAKAHYAYEELVAEMTSAFLCAHVGIENTRDSAAYLGSWMKHIKGDVAQQFMQAAVADYD